MFFVDTVFKCIEGRREIPTIRSMRSLAGCILLFGCLLHGFVVGEQKCWGSNKPYLAKTEMKHQRCVDWLMIKSDSPFKSTFYGKHGGFFHSAHSLSKQKQRKHGPVATIFREQDTSLGFAISHQQHRDFPCCHGHRTEYENHLNIISSSLPWN